MLLHKLIYLWGIRKDFEKFYQIQAADTADWLARNQLIDFDSRPKVLDLGCGTGTMGVEFEKRGCEVTFADFEDCLYPSVNRDKYRTFDIENDPFSILGQFDLVLSSNVLEHLKDRRTFLKNVTQLLNSEGTFYLSFTNWLSPWGGHEFSPFQYLGPKWGPSLWDRLLKKPRSHELGKNLFPTHIGSVLDWIAEDESLKIVKAVPRYYPELSWLVKIPMLREFLTWNLAIAATRNIS